MKIRLVVRGVMKEYTYDSYELQPAHCLDIGLYPNTQYAIGIDPSTTSTGIVIGNLVDFQADYLILLTRNHELDDSEFNRNIYTFAENLFSKLHTQIQGVQLEQPFRHKQTTLDKFAKQMANFKTWVSVVERFDIDLFKVVPNSWRGTFTRTYGHLLKGDLRKITKKQIQSVYIAHECRDLLNLPCDISDAYGIYKHFLAVNLDAYTASKEKEREYQHDIIYVITEQKHVEAFVQEYLDKQRHKNPNAKMVAFNYCQQLSPEDNIRCFTSAKKSSKYNVFASSVYPNISMMKHLYRFKATLPESLTPTTQLYLIGFRLN